MAIGYKIIWKDIMFMIIFMIGFVIYAIFTGKVNYPFWEIVGSFCLLISGLVLNKRLEYIKVKDD